MKYQIRLYYIIFLAFAISACQQGLPKDQAPPKKKDRLNVATGRPSLKKIVGISFTEVRRQFDNGLAFHFTGFQLEPEWTLTFTSDSTVKIYSPTKKSFIHYPMYYSHATVFNFAREWLRIKTISPDSLVFELLEVENKIVLKKKQKVYMTFYSDHYIKDVLRTSISTLRRPTKKDTLYVKARAEEAAADLQKAFPARSPAELRSTSPILRVEKLGAEEDLIRGIEKTDAYLLPKYNITINKAYKDFAYYFSVTIDTKGRIHFNRFLQVVDPEFLPAKTKVVQGILDVYLKNLMRIRPGRTLGIPHASTITLYVSGKKERS